MLVPFDRIQAAGPLFELVQLLHVHPDSKWFPDCTPVRPVAEIQERVRECLEAWRSQAVPAEADLGTAVEAARGLHELSTRIRSVIELCFEPPAPARDDDLAPAPTMDEHIRAMWDRLTRPAVDPGPESTLLPVRHPYVVPGGRYIEFYYWDSYFTAVGLRAAGRLDLLDSVVANMADLIRAHGFVPNGTRTYYLSRSQPPFFTFLLRLLASARGEPAASAYVSDLAREHAFWDRGGRVLAAGDDPADVLNRYWDDLPEPRPEGFREDRATWYEARDAGLRGDEGGVYRDLRAAAESGWDFSSRWLDPAGGPTRGLARVRTTSVVPVDLNALMYAMETQLAGWLEGDAAEGFRARAERRRGRLTRPPFWDPETGWFHDAVIEGGSLVRSPVESLAGVYPLFCGVADDEQAARVARRVEQVYLRAGGVVTTPEAFESGQQWDYPNGWAPLQWVSAAGLCRYGHVGLAREVAARFVRQAESVFDRTGAMMEKYDVCHPGRPGGGGEYANQEGFGWTNAVVSAFQAFLRGGAAADFPAA